MKDAKGHGSDAHQAGVEQATAPKVYSWGKVGRGHSLMANGNLADHVGSVMPQLQSNGKRAYVGSYSFNGTGNAPSGWSHHGSVQGAKKYVESNLSKFWQPPKVK